MKQWTLMTLMLILCVAAMLAIAGCQTGSVFLSPAGSYLPGENFGNGGATRCGTVNTPKKWLKPCVEVGAR